MREPLPTSPRVLYRWWMRWVTVMMCACGGGSDPLPVIDGMPHSDAPPIDTPPIVCNLPPNLGTLVETGLASASYTPPGGMDERITRLESLSVPGHVVQLFIDVTAGGTEFPTGLAPKSNISMTNPNTRRVHVILFTDVGESTHQDFGAVSGTLDITQIQPNFAGSLVNVHLVHSPDASQPVDLGDGCATTLSLTFNTMVQ